MTSSGFNQFFTAPKSPCYTDRFDPGSLRGKHIHIWISHIQGFFRLNPDLFRISYTISGAGFTGIPSRCPNTDTKSIPGKNTVLTFGFLPDIYSTPQLFSHHENLKQTIIPPLYRKGEYNRYYVPSNIPKIAPHTRYIIRRTTLFRQSSLEQFSYSVPYKMKIFLLLCSGKPQRRKA